MSWEVVFGEPTCSGPCPLCGGKLTFGYGLAGGGIGGYEMCLTEGCDYFLKAQDESVAPHEDERSGKGE